MISERRKKANLQKGQTYREVDDGSLLEGVSTFQPTPLAVLDSCVDGFGIIMYTVALSSVGRDITIKFVASASQWLLSRVSLGPSHMNFQTDRSKWSQ